PDQYPGVECRRGSGARRRTRARVCRGCLRGAYPGAAFGQCGEGDQVPDRRFGRQGHPGRHPGRPGRHHHGRDRCQCAARHQHHGRDFLRVAGAVLRHRAGQPDRDPDGRNHPAECCAGGRSHCRRTGDGRTGPAAHRSGRRVQGCRTRTGGAPVVGHCQCARQRPQHTAPDRPHQHSRARAPQHRCCVGNGKRRGRLAGVL
ncbi:hypothetical protein XPN_1560, partial [Xanthomonas arboricola pv. pruni MAFF 301427]